MLFLTLYLFCQFAGLHTNIAHMHLSPSMCVLPVCRLCVLPVCRLYIDIAQVQPSPAMFLFPLWRPTHWHWTPFIFLQPYLCCHYAGIHIDIAYLYPSPAMVLLPLYTSTNWHCTHAPFSRYVCAATVQACTLTLYSSRFLQQCFCCHYGGLHIVIEYLSIFPVIFVLSVCRPTH